MNWGTALMMRYYGARIIRILVTPAGGVAEFALLPKTSKYELITTFEGQAVNFIFVIIIGSIFGYNTHREYLNFRSINIIQILSFIYFVNLYEGLFNLLPIFPMGGGRILRSTLALWLDCAKATCIALNIGKALATTALAITVFWIQDRC